MRTTHHRAKQCDPALAKDDLVRLGGSLSTGTLGFLLSRLLFALIIVRLLGL